MNPPERVRDLRGFERAAGDLAQTLLASSEVSVIGHIDADGISAASIASNALRRGGVRHSVRFVKKLDEEEIARVNSHPSEAIWLVDLGSGSYSKLEHPQVCVADHHVPESPGTGRRKGRVDLFSFVERHLNPHLFGIDGSVEISSAGVAYMVARAMAKENVDLAPIAIVGAVGDFQDSAECRLRGMNREILDEASQLGAVSAVKDLRIFGRETRPVAKMLQYSTDPILPYLTNDAVACQRFLSDLGIPLTEGERWRCWVDLGKEERRTVASALSNHLLDCGAGHWAVRRLIGEVYVLSKEEKGTVLHDAKEFSTLLNACGRYGQGSTGLAICSGERGETLRKGLGLLQNHRGNLADAVALVKDLGVVRGRNLQYFHGRDEILDSIVGIVAGMVLGSGEIPTELPIVAFAFSEEDKIKVSARGTRELVNRGLDLAEAVKLASERVGGTGGGHNIAAGATISSGKEMDFIEEMEKIVEGQLSNLSG